MRGWTKDEEAGEGKNREKNGTLKKKTKNQEIVYGNGDKFLKNERTRRGKGEEQNDCEGGRKKRGL